MTYTTVGMTMNLHRSLLCGLFSFSAAQPGPSDEDCNIEIGDDATYTETIEMDSSAYNGYIRHIESSGCPNYPTEPVLYDFTAVAQNPEADVPAYPCFSDADYDVTCETSAIGVFLNGVVFFSMKRGGCNVCDSSCDAVDDEHEDFNQCGGHASDFGTYVISIKYICPCSIQYR